jgi:cation diffusion facilitator family transporter
MRAETPVGSPEFTEARPVAATNGEGTRTPTSVEHEHDHPHPHADEHDHPHPHADEHDLPHPHADEHDHGDHDHGDHGHDHGDHGHDHGHGHDHVHRGGVIGKLQELFVPHTHDAADQIDDVMETSAQGIKATKVGLVGLLLTTFIQTVILLMTGSVALLAETIHSFGDSLTAIPIWAAFSLGKRTPNRKYTYGYRKAEDLAGLFVVFMITLTTIVALYESIDRLINPQPIEHLQLVALAGLAGFAGKELVAIYRMRVGRKIGSVALYADGQHAQTDGLAGLAVVVAAIGVFMGYPQADAIVGLIISVVIGSILISTAREVFGRLMDAVDPELVETLEQKALQPGVQEVTSTRLRWLGHRLEAEVHITVDSELTTAQSHAIAEEVRHRVFHDMSKISDVIVHVDPCTHAVADHHTATRDHLPVAPRAISVVDPHPLPQP